MFMLTSILVAFGLSQANAASPACAAIDADLSADLKGWATTGTGVAIGSSFVLPATGGTATTTVSIVTGGRYRIALDQTGAVEVLRTGEALAAEGQVQGPACTTIRKIVDFDLPPGAYTIRLTDIERPQARLMIFRESARAN